MSKGFEIIRVVPQEELGGPLNAVHTGNPFSSPKGFYGPGVLANMESKLSGLLPGLYGKAGLSPQQVYNSVVPQAEFALDAVGSMVAPSKTIAQRIGAGVGIPALIKSLGGGSASDIAVSGGIGGGAQGIVEGILGAVKQPFMRKAKDAAVGAYEKLLKGHTADEATRLATHKAETQAEKITHDWTVSDLKDRHAQQVAAHAQQRQTIRSKDAETLRQARGADKVQRQQAATTLAEKQAAQDAVQAAAVGSHSDQAAQKIMDQAKSVIPEWRGLSSDVPGIIDAVLGKGQTLLSDAYDTAMKAAVETARGTSVSLPIEDIKKLGIALKFPAPGPGVAKVYRGDPVTGAADLTHLDVDAGDVILKLTGMRGKRDWGLYRRTVDTLNANELGIDPAAREAYATGQGVIEAVNRNKGLMYENGQTTLNTENILRGMHDVDRMDIFRDRNLGDFYTSEMLAATKGAPQPLPPVAASEMAPFMPPAKTPIPAAPAPLQLPDAPAPRSPLAPGPPPLDPLRKEGGEVVERDLGSRALRAGTGTAAGALASGMGHALGIPGMGWGAYSIPAAIGAIAGASTPNKWVTKAPGTEPLIALLGELAKPAGAGMREGVTNPLAELIGLLDVPPEDLAEIRAAQATGQTAKNRPGLSLETDPSELR